MTKKNCGNFIKYKGRKTKFTKYCTRGIDLENKKLKLKA